MPCPLRGVEETSSSMFKERVEKRRESGLDKAMMEGLA
jgi:hypothetical protein